MASYFPPRVPLILSGTIVLLWTLGGNTAEAASQDRPLVRVDEVKSWQGGSEQTLHCKVQTPHQYQIASHGEARLKWVLSAGTQVEKGQLIAEQDGYYLERDIARLDIELASAEVEASHAGEEYQRLQALSQQQLVSQSQLKDLARISQQAELSARMLDEQLKEARYRLAHLKHHAPAAGQIMALASQPGEHLAIGQGIAQLQPVENKELLCDLPLIHYRQSNELTDVSFHLMDGSQLRLSRRSIDLQQDTQTLRIYLQASPAEQERLLLGERLSVVLSHETPGLSRIPHDALELSEDNYYVWQLTPDNNVTQQSVRIIATHEAYLLVESSLVAGDKVVTRGKQGLSEDQGVTPGNSEVSS